LLCEASKDAHTDDDAEAGVEGGDDGETGGDDGETGGDNGAMSCIEGGAGATVD